jgi:hypothetical protein
MVARTRRLRGLVVSFSRDGETVGSTLAPTGRDAVKAALLMIVRQDELQEGDRLEVVPGADIREET